MRPHKTHEFLLKKDMEFKDRLRSLRKERKMRQLDIAKILNYGQVAVCNLEKGHTEPHPRELIILADLFGVTVDYLVGRTDERG